MTTISSFDYQYTEKKFGDLLYYYILASREDHINVLDNDPFEELNLERFDNIQRHPQYKIECKKYVNIKSDARYIMSFMFGKMIEELKIISSSNIKKISNITLTSRQNEIVISVQVENRDNLANKFITSNIWKAINESISDEASVINFMYSTVKDTFDNILDISVLGSASDNKQYFKQKIEQLLKDSWSILEVDDKDRIIENIHSLFDNYLKCLSDIINRYLIYNHSTLKGDIILGIFNLKYMPQELLDEIAEDLENRKKK